MPHRALTLFDDSTARGWQPYSLTRPVGELLFGAVRLRERWERVLGVRCTAHLASDHLVGFEELDAPSVRPFSEAPSGGRHVLISSRAVPAWTACAALRADDLADGPIRISGEVVGWATSDGATSVPAGFLDDPAAHGDAARGTEIEGVVLTRYWELMVRTPDQLADDIAALFPNAGVPRLGVGTHRIGDGAIVLGAGARVEPGVVLDTTAGPIWLDEGATVRAFTRLAGPAYVGRGSTVLGGALEAVSIGPVCRIRGEFAESVAVAYVNKAHDGHIGHAYLGAWVNLGAETTNSDLKNNYGKIRLWTPDGEVDTGSIKIGSFLGDHVKTGIGLLLNTGTVVGPGSNLFGSVMPPKHVPPFRWGTGDELTEYRVDKFLETTERAMSRRQVTLTPSARAQLERAWANACTAP